MSAARTTAGVEDDAWERWVAEQEALSEVEAELRERAADLDDAELVGLGRRLLDAAWPDWSRLDLEFRHPLSGRVVRRVAIRPT